MDLQALTQPVGPYFKLNTQLYNVLQKEMAP